MRIHSTASVCVHVAMRFHAHTHATQPHAHYTALYQNATHTDAHDKNTSLKNFSNPTQNIPRTIVAAAGEFFPFHWVTNPLHGTANVQSGDTRISRQIFRDAIPGYCQTFAVFCKRVPTPNYCSPVGRTQKKSSGKRATASAAYRCQLRTRWPLAT